MKAVSGGLSVLCLFSLLGAWTYEQIEPPGSWDWTELEILPGGMICVCYHDASTGDIIVTRKDSVWHREILGEWRDAVGRHLVPGPAQKPAVLLKSDTVTNYAVLTDSGWDYTTVFCTTGFTYLAFDSSGAPTLLYFVEFNPIFDLFSTCLRSGVWVKDTIELGYYDGLWWYGPTCPATFVLGPGNRFYNDRGHFLGFTMGGSSVYVDTGRTGGWNRIFSSLDRHAYPVSLALGPSGEFALCHSAGTQFAWRFFCNRDTVEPVAVATGRARIDSRGITHVVYRCGVMKHAYKTSNWHRDTLPPEINAATSFDFAIDGQDIPVIAFLSDNGIFLAVGEAVGVEAEAPRSTERLMALPTVVRNELTFPATGTLLDITGRRVLDLKPGTNDVRGLAPGVYFLCPSSGGVRAAWGVRKVLLH